MAGKADHFFFGLLGKITPQGHDPRGKFVVE
jgi:hypothetical protein